MRLRAYIACVLFLLLLGQPLEVHAQSGAEETYEQGYEAFRSGEFVSAIDFFKQALSKMDPGSVDYAQVHYNLGRCVERIIENESDIPLACRGAAWFKIYLERVGSKADLRSRDRASVGMASLQSVCESARTVTDASGMESLAVRDGTRVLPWALSGFSVVLISGGLYALSQFYSAIDDRDSARIGYESSVGEPREEYRFDVRRSEIKASASGTAAAVLSGTGVVVGVTAVLAWLDVDAPTISHTPTETRLSYTWQW